MQISTSKFPKKTLRASNFPVRLILSLLMGMIKYSQITQSNKFAISSQYLKKEVRNWDHFCYADKCQSFYKLVLFFLIEVALHIQNTQNRKLIIFFQYIKKKLSQLLCVLRWCKRLRYFLGVFGVFLVICLLCFDDMCYFSKENFTLIIFFFSLS